jgi:hypothetical protein
MAAENGSLQIKENMYGDALVEISPEQVAAAKLDPADEEAKGESGMRESDSWQLADSSAGKKGMHVTFQVLH